MASPLATASRTRRAAATENFMAAVEQSRPEEQQMSQFAVFGQFSVSVWT